MKVQVIIDSSFDEPEITIRTNCMTKDIELLLNFLESPPSLPVRDSENRWFLLHPEEVFRIWADNKNVFVKTEQHIFRIADSLSRL